MDWSRCFPKLNESDLKKLLAVSEQAEFMLGDQIVEEGQKLDHFFVLQKGHVGIERSLSGGVWAQFINPLEESDVFGEMSFISPIQASATLIALTDIQTISFPTDKVKELVAEDEGFAARLYHSFGIVLVNRLMRTNQRTDTFEPRL
tara:strand:- start:4406 stop:4846 length:441 start_codon:yes stop_codon:yes gene_type:complete